MYCDGCGTTIHAGMGYCQRCGKRIVGGASAPAGQPAAPVRGIGADTGRVGRNIQLLGGLWMVYGALRLVSLGAFVVLPAKLDVQGLRV
ncbi:MAG: hypothetical protein NVS9B14_22090 [Candidatus Acidiferrum sp.]